MKNKWVAVRSIKEDIAGSWNVTAKTDNGDMEHAMVMKKEGNRFSGYASSSEGDADFSNLKLEKNTLSMQVPYGGGIVKIKSKLIAKGQLKGKWTFFDEFDQEVATGEWIAIKKAKILRLGQRHSIKKPRNRFGSGFFFLQSENFRCQDIGINRVMELRSVYSNPSDLSTFEVQKLDRHFASLRSGRVLLH